ncbi:MAG: acyltransferase, partial [Planctomycetes bacterium]|nr:acyltransferase [Planctomycetota bacterium]
SDVVICAGVMLSSVVGDGTDDGGTIRIGDRVVIRENVQITAADVIRIDDGVAIGRNCLIADHDHGYQLLDRSILDNPLTPARPVVLEAGCLIGSCSRIAPGVRVGRHALIGFGSVVTRDVPAFAVAAGAPARLLRRYHPETGRWETA